MSCKHFVTTVCSIIVAVSGLLVATQVPISARTDSFATIPFVAHDTATMPLKDTAGSPCSVPRTTTFHTFSQLVVRNEAGRVIEVQDLDSKLMSGQWEKDAYGGNGICDIAFTISPPTASFYEIFLDGQLVTTIDTSAPLNLPGDAIDITSTLLGSSGQ